MSVSKSGGQQENGLLPENVAVEKVNRDIAFQFAEGPAWDGKGNLYFSDIPAWRTYVLNAQGQFWVFQEGTNRRNGLAFNHNGNLVTCEQIPPGITEVDAKEGRLVRVIASRYRGRPFNSPNDLVVDRKGGIYFSDPDFRDRRVDGTRQEVEAVYYITPDGEAARVCQDAVKPNGVVLSPDEQLLYVADTCDRYVWAYEVQANGTLRNGQRLGELQLPDWPTLLREGDRFTRASEYPNASLADGMTVDEVGNLYVATRLGVQVVSKDGAYLGTIPVSETPSNCAFGGPDMDTLYITAVTSIYKVTLNTRGVLFPQSK